MATILPERHRTSGRRRIISRSERINGLLTRWRDKLAGDAGAKVAFQMVEILGANPFVTARGAEQRLGIAYVQPML